MQATMRFLAMSGVMMTGFAAHAFATARAASGAPIARATSAYERVSPRGIAASASQTRRRNALPRTSSGSASASLVPSQ